MFKITPLNQLPYFWWGFALMAIKYNLDRAIAWIGFHRTWYFWNYLKPHGFRGVAELPPDDQLFYIALLATSVPFLAVGLLLTLRRLRSAGLPLEFCLLFFAPILNLIFFLMLCVIPTASAAQVSMPRRRWIDWLPVSEAGSALASIFLVGGTGALFAVFSTQLLQNYGWGLFVAEPFAMGLVSVLIHAGRVKRSLASCLGVAVLPIIFCGFCLLAAAAEGAVCLIMAAPIGLILALLGGFAGYLIVGNRAAPLQPASMLLILAAVPFTMGMEQRSEERAPLTFVTSSVIINAPPEKVWPNVVAFSPIPPERDWILHTGVAYPTRARIDGTGVGAVRHCIFTTGEFVEPIEVWQKNRLLRFSVAAQPEPMEELSPYTHLETPHLHGYLQSQEGQLELTPLPGDKTRLEGTTWYTDQIWPSAYWQLWSDLVIHHIHLRVLNHIKALSEKSTR